MEIKGANSDNSIKLPQCDIQISLLEDDDYLSEEYSNESS